MRVTRVHLDQPLADGMDIALPESAATHLARVLRLGIGDEFAAFNGDGCDYAARITASSRRELRVRIGPGVALANESTLRVVLLQGIARGEKMDLILQKATELGIAEVRPLTSQRSEVKLDEARAAKRLAHWRNVVIAACEQSGRARIPGVLPPGSLAAVLDGLPMGGIRLILDPHGPLAFSGMAIESGAVVSLAVGPEGGWSPLDRAQLEAAGFAGLRLGPRILRTETAGLAAIAALQSGFGDLR